MTFKFEALNPHPVGGQQAGIPYTHVKCTHEETEIYAVCMSYRSQHVNKRIAQAMVEYGLAEMGWKEA